MRLSSFAQGSRGWVENAKHTTRHRTTNLDASLDSSRDSLSNEHHIKYSRGIFRGIKFIFSVGRTFGIQYERDRKNRETHDQRGVCPAYLYVLLEISL